MSWTLGKNWVESGGVLPGKKEQCTNNGHHYNVSFLLFLFFLRFYLFWERERKRARVRGKGQGRKRSRLPAKQGGLTWGSIPGPQDHDLTHRQTLKWLRHPGTPSFILIYIEKYAYITQVHNFINLSILSCFFISS